MLDSKALRSEWARLGNSFVTRQRVILNGGEAGARDRSADETIETISRVARAAYCVVCPAHFISAFSPSQGPSPGLTPGSG